MKWVKKHLDWRAGKAMKLALFTPERECNQYHPDDLHHRLVTLRGLDVLTVDEKGKLAGYYCDFLTVE